MLLARVFINIDWVSLMIKEKLTWHLLEFYYFIENHMEIK